MGKPIVRDFTQGKGILKFFPYQGAACVVPQSMKSDADANGKKIVPAGTPFFSSLTTSGIRKEPPSPINISTSG